MTEQEWQYYVQTHLKKDGYAFSSRWRNYHVPDHGERMGALSHKVEWQSGSLPTFYNPYWYLKKWVEEGNVSYRAEITSFSLVRQTWSGVVKVEFSYKTERYDDKYERWVTI